MMNHNASNLDGHNVREIYDAILAPYAQHNSQSRGRAYPESTDPDRLPYQRDRDRIIHTTAWRRLKGKMQVVAPSRGDHFRTRLTHTIEVAQIARDLARWLRLNEDLSESIALAHDLGHPPFGHNGEHALDQQMRAHGFSFDHNLQSLRIVTQYEKRYPEYTGLNLTYEVLDGLRKHDRSFTREDGSTVRFPHLEAQLVDLADEIAYLSADMEDGLRGGFFTINDLRDVAIPRRILADMPSALAQDRTTLVRYTIRLLLRELVNNTRINLAAYNIQTFEDAITCSHRIVAFSPDFYRQFLDLKKFLFRNYYEKEEVVSYVKKGERILSDIFQTLQKTPSLLPETFQATENLPQRICDYIAGMTDQYATDFWEGYCQ